MTIRVVLNIHTKKGTNVALGSEIEIRLQGSDEIVKDGVSFGEEKTVVNVDD
jgi:hypothetical protein